MLNYLKIKCVSLAAESKLIRNDENKRIRFAANARRSVHNIDYANYHDAVRAGLYHHRKTVVRPECRSAHLAYCFLKGYKYEQIERTCYEAPDFYRIRRLIESYGYDQAAVASAEDFDLWKNEAIHHIQQCQAQQREAARLRSIKESEKLKEESDGN